MDRKDSLPSTDEIAALELPDRARTLCERYERRIGHRQTYLWQWLYAVFPRYRLSSVPQAHHESLRELKLVLTMFYTTLDDVADTRGDEATFLEALKLPLPGATPDPERDEVDGDAIAFTTAAWETVGDALGTTPRASEFWSVFRFDVQQVLNAMHYGCLVNDAPELATRVETDAYAVHNMAQFSYADMDLMHSPEFDRTELRSLRQVIWPAQRLARIANWVATWEREVAEGDPTSGILVEALSRDIVDVAELSDPSVPDEELVQRIRAHGIEQRYRDEWDRIYEELSSERHAVDSVDTQSYLAGIRDMRDLYLDNRGRI